MPDESNRPEWLVDVAGLTNREISSRFCRLVGALEVIYTWGGITEHQRLKCVEDAVREYMGKDMLP